MASYPMEPLPGNATTPSFVDPHVPGTCSQLDGAPHKGLDPIDANGATNVVALVPQVGPDLANIETMLASASY